MQSVKQNIDISIIYSTCLFSRQNNLHNEQKSKIKYIQQCPNWYFVTKKGNVKTILNKITKQNNWRWKVSLEMKSTIKVKLK